MPIRHGFSFFGHGNVVEKSWKVIVVKEWAPWIVGISRCHDVISCKLAVTHDVQNCIHFIIYVAVQITA